jgi:hypothetical protein
MPTRALSMREIRELIPLKYQAGLSHEQIAGALAISKGVVAKYAPFHTKVINAAVRDATHIHLTGDYVWHANRRAAKGRYRPLRAPKSPSSGA